jgi:peptidoglycan/LPS O-acetylase OafA/YrhL
MPPALAPVTSRIAHIDGLRAIAVLLVIGYHAGVPGFGGGFIGVDIFFVISGYLIINHIVDELGRGVFSVKLFYARRALRLLPPLFVMLAVSTLVATVVLVSPYEWKWYTHSAITAALSASNIYFLSRQGYFDINASEKPLLHTWSLGVEEQFYLVVPLLLVACFALAARWRANSYRVLAIAGAAIFVVSLAGCIWQTPDSGRNFAFYLPYWRAWEFAAGGAIGFLATRPLGRIGLVGYEIAGLASLALLLASNLLIGETMTYPGYLAIAPVAATVLLIASGLAVPHSVAARLLSIPVLTGIGLVSYGWYLWHWPAIAFGRIAGFGDPSLARDVAMAVLALCLAVLTYWYVEKPARRWREGHDLRLLGGKVVSYAVAASLAMAAFSFAVGSAAEEWTSGSPALAWDQEALVAAADCPPAVCEAASGQSGVLVGDSHADKLSKGAIPQAARLGVEVERAPVARPDQNFAIVMFRWNSYLDQPDNDEASVSSEIAKLSDGGRRRILLVGPVPEFAYKGAQCVLRAIRYGSDRDKCSVSRASVEERRGPAVGLLQHIAETTPNTRYVDPIDLFCDATVCRPSVDGLILMEDEDHLIVPDGGYWLYNALKHDFWWVFGGRAGSLPANSP